MTDKRFTLKYINEEHLSANLFDNETFIASVYIGEKLLVELLNQLVEENEKLKSQLYCDEEEGVCNICKHHYLVKDDEAELGYYNSRCKKGHYECARVSLKHCEDFEKEVE